MSDSRTRWLLVRSIAAVLVTGSAGVMVTSAQAVTDRALTPTTEAWYQPSPAGPPPAQPPVTSLYAAGTLHVGFGAAQETARSYLALPLAGLDRLTAASLTVPLDIAQTAGGQSPELAKIQVCLTSATIAPAAGSFDAPPKVDCSTSVPATYVATPQPHLSADLAPVLAALANATGVALLPDATKVAPTDVWRVVFSAHDRADAAKTAPATLTVREQSPDPLPIPAESPAAMVSLPDVGSAGLTGFEAPVGTGFAPAPATEVEPVTPVLPPSTLAAEQSGQSETITVGYAYPAVWLLPLAFLVLVPVAAKALTKDLSSRA